MIDRRALCAALLLAGPAAAIDVPSGQPIDLQEVLVENVGTQVWLRFRFVAPRIDRRAGDLGFEDVAPDMGYLCDALAIPYAAEYDLAGDVIVISLADRPTEFGESAPEATQFFEAFRIEDGRCIWEGF